MMQKTRTKILSEALGNLRSVPPTRTSSFHTVLEIAKDMLRNGHVEDAAALHDMVVGVAHNIGASKDPETVAFLDDCKGAMRLLQRPLPHDADGGEPVAATDGFRN